MLKKTIKYTDFNGDEVSEDYFFHLSQAELVELELSKDGGLSDAMKRIIDAEDGKGIVAEFKNIILMSYGVKSADGKRFIKNQKLREEFESSEAYSTLFMELVTNADASSAFINGIVPPGLAGTAAEITKEKEDKPVITAVPDPNGPRVLTKADITAMSNEEFMRLGSDLTRGKVRIADE